MQDAAMQDRTAQDTAAQGAARSTALLRLAQEITDEGAHFLAETPLTEALVFVRRADGLHTNVPCSVRHHSTAGWEWGYGGSGPADLALNACEALLKEFCWRGERIACFDGTCYAAAWQMHQDFKRRFIATLPYGGGRIEYGTVRLWVMDWLRAVFGGTPVDELLAAAGLETIDGRPFEDWDAWEQG